MINEDITLSLELSLQLQELEFFGRFCINDREDLNKHLFFWRRLGNEHKVLHREELGIGAYILFPALTAFEIRKAMKDYHGDYYVREIDDEFFCCRVGSVSEDYIYIEGADTEVNAWGKLLILHIKNGWTKKGIDK